MEKKPTLKQKLEMEKYVIALRAKMQSRAEKLQQTCQDEQKCKLARLQDEIVALADSYRHYYYQVFTDANNSFLRQIDNIEQVEKIFNSAKAQMIAGDISQEHLIEVAEGARKALKTACLVGNLGEYADMILEETQKDKEQEER